MLNVRSYALVTACYWAFTLTDGALRMLVLLHFQSLGYTAVSLAFLFLLYEACGVATNLLGGWIGSRIGLKATLFAGLAIQIVALLMLSGVDVEWAAWFSVTYAMCAQALSGVAKDLTKMSSKSAVKLLVREGDDAGAHSLLFKWVAVLTGSKNALKGVGFFLGGVLLSTAGFVGALWGMAGALCVVLMLALVRLREDMGRSKQKVKFTQMFSRSREINRLSAARFFLFGSRDVWFVVGLPVFLVEQLAWSHSGVGGFLAAWVIGYGCVQALAPRFLRGAHGVVNGTRAARFWGFGLAAISAGLTASLYFDFYPVVAVVAGLCAFGVVFAINSSVHSYLILAFTDSDQVAVNVGFYYMANACGRLVGTLLSGVVYLVAGLAGCLAVSTVMVICAAGLAAFLSGASRRAELATH